MEKGKKESNIKLLQELLDQTKSSIEPKPQTPKKQPLKIDAIQNAQSEELGNNKVKTFIRLFY